MMRLKRLLGNISLVLGLLFCAQVVSAQTTDLVITEINYNGPEAGTDSTEYIEIYNKGSVAINLSGYSFSSGVVFTFPNISISAQSYIVVSVDSQAVFNVFGVTTYQWVSGSLSNGGEPISLRDNLNRVVDSLRYDDATPWPSGGVINPDGGGSSLVLCDPNSDNAMGANWIQSSTAIAGKFVNGKQVYGSPGLLDTGCSASLSGTYTIGGLTPDYPTIDSAVSDLTTLGVSSAVTFHIRPDTYSEQLILDSIVGVDSINTVTFMTEPSASSNAIITNNSDYTIKFQGGVSYVTFRDLTIQTTGQANVIRLGINNDHISFINDSLIGAIVTIESNSLDVILDSIAITNTSNFTLDSNVILNGSTSFYQRSASASNKEEGFVITNNTILDFYRTGLYLRHSDDILVENNYIYTVSSAPLVYGFYGDINNGINIIGNKIFIDAGSAARPLMLWSPTGTTSNRIQIANNSTSMINSSNSNGHYNYIYTPRFCDIVFNSMYGHTNNTNEVLYLDARGTASTFQNNNIYNNGSGFAVKTLGTGIAMDYNNLYGNGGAANLSGGTMGSNSISVNPNFISTTNLSPTNSALEGVGIAFAGITKDINGVTRQNPPTIGSSVVVQGPLSGTYTIGGSSPDYLNFSAAIADLDSYGVGGTVVFNVRQGTYTEQVILDSIQGSSGSNSITFQSDPANSARPLLTFSSTNSAATSTIEFDGADYITFKNLDIKATGTYANVIKYSGYTDHNTIDSCKLEGLPLSGFQYAIIHHENSNSGIANYCVIENCEIVNGYYGVYMWGPSANDEIGNDIINNTFINPRVQGIQAYNQDSMLVSGNSILFSSTAVISQTGIKLVSCTHSDIIENTVQTYTAGFSEGIWASLTSFVSGDPCLIANNEVYNLAVSSNRETGILLNAFRVDVLFNSVNITSTNTTEGIGLNIVGASVVNVQNNVLANNGGGLAMKVAGTPSNFESDYNNLYTSGGHIGQYNNVNMTNLATWTAIAQYDSNSVDYKPNFLSNDSLVPDNGLMNNIGIPISGITTDLNGTARNVSTPDIGAYEFTGVTPPMAGFYTVGGTTPDYLTLDLAAQALNTRGISAAVTFLIRPNTYVEHMFVDTIIGGDSSKLVTFRNDTNFTGTVLIKDSLTKDNPGLFTFKNSGFVKIIGLDFEENGLSVNTSSCIRLEGLCTDFYIDSCNFKANSSTFNNYFRSAIGTGESHVEVSTDYPSGMTYQSERMEISNCHFDGFSYPVTINGRSDHFTYATNPVGKVTNCTMLNVTKYSFFGGFLDSLVYSQNNVSGSSALFSLTGNRSVAIDKNKFLTQGDNYISFINGIGNLVSAVNPILITNNVFRSEQSSSNTERIGFDLRSDDNYSFYNNTIYFETVSGDTAHHKVFSIEDVKNLTLKNNNIYFNGGNGYVYDLDRPSGHNYILDYNNIYSSSDSLVLVDGIGLSSLSRIQSLGYEANSLSIHPRFNNDTLLEPHVTELVNTGTPILGITNDILGVTRDATPSIGAYEYTYVCGGLSGVYTIDASRSGSRNYTTISSAVDDLNEQGICAAVIFNIKQGTYDELIRIEDIYNSGDSGSVTFQSDPSNTSDVVLTYSSLFTTNALWRVEGATHLNFKKLFFKKGTYTNYLLDFVGAVSDIEIDSCEFELTKGSGRALEANDCELSNLVVKNSLFNVCNVGVYIVGDNTTDQKNVTVSNCQFVDVRIPLWFSSADSCTISNNSITNPTDTNSNTTIGSFFELKNSNIYNNRWNINGASSGGQLKECEDVHIYNNVFTLDLANIGAYFNDNRRMLVDFNSWNLKSGLEMFTIKDSGSVFRNNIFYSQTGYPIYGLDVSATNNSFSNNNIYTYNDTVGYIGTTGYEVTAWGGLSYVSNVLNHHPRFTNDTTLIPRIPDLESAGTPIPGITKDIRDSVRSSTNPSIGAYEYVYNCLDIGLSGIYTIDPSGSGNKNYTSISAAVNDLNDFGICNDVIFNIKQGTYTDSIVSESWYNSPESGSVTFQSDPGNTSEVLLSFMLSSASSKGWTMEGTKNVVFRNLKFTSASTSGFDLALIFLEDSTDGITIDSCRFNGTVFMSGISSKNTFNDYNGIGNVQVYNSFFENIGTGLSIVSYSAVTSNASPKTKIYNNTFRNNNVSIEIGGLDSTEVYNNSTTGLNAATSFGISVRGAKGVKIYDNMIYSKYVGIGMQGGGNTLIYNNEVYGGSAAVLETYHIVPNEYTFNYNTLKSGKNEGVVLLSGVARNLYFFNNIVVANNKAVLTIPINTSYIGNYNSFFGNDTSSNNSWSGPATTIQTLDSIQNNWGGDANSISMDPYFISDTLLKPYRRAMDNKGIPITGINTDIEGTTRTNPPDIGAYQFTPIHYNVSIDSIGVDTLCAGPQVVRALLRNLGDSTVTNVKINWSIDQLGASNGFDSLYTFSGSLDTNLVDSAWVTLANYPFIANSDFQITVSADTINGYLDDDPFNNEFTDTISIRPQPNAGFTVQKACLADSVVLIAEGGVNYNWTGPNTLSDTSIIVVLENPDTTANGSYSLTAFDAYGCSETYTSTVTLDSIIQIGLQQNDTICSDTSVTLNANNNSQYAYLWNNGEATPTIVVDSAFKYIVEVLDGNNCINRDSFELTVHTNPTVSFDSTIQAACAFGDPVLLNHASPKGIGGVYSGFNVSGDTLTPRAFGIYPVKYTYEDVNGCSGFADTVVVVNRRPSVTLSNIADLCVNDTLFSITENSPISVTNGRFSGGSWLVNDSVGIFNPRTAGVGTHTVHYTYTDTSTGCFSIDSNTITVNDTFAIAFAAATYCINDGNVTLTKPTGFVSSYTGYYLDTNSNNAVVGTHEFNPFIADVGIQTLQYTVVNDDNCTSINYRDINVDSIPVVSLQLDTFCVNSLTEVLAGGLPAGGTYYYGKGVNFGSYNPANAGVGLDTVNYSVTIGNGCSDTASAVFLIRDIPNVSFTLPALNIERCIDAESFILTGQSPVTNPSLGIGTFTGPGVDTNKFIASVAGVGTHTIRFDYMDQFGCADTSYDSIIVHALPQPAFTSPFSNICLNKIPDSVFATPAGLGGVFSGVGIGSDGFFNPSLVGADSNRTIKYTYIDDNGCSNFVIDTFIIDTIPQITMTLIPDQCLNGVEVTLNQGKYNTGNFAYKSASLGLLTAAKLLPFNLGSGIDTITYVYTDLVGCKDSLSQPIEVLDTTDVTFYVPMSRAEVCENEATFNLSSATPIGGIYTGNGLVGNKFTPSIAAIGNNVITYSYTDTNNCTSVTDTIIKVNAITPVTFANQVFCLNDTIEVLTGGSPSTGTFQYSGGGMLNNTVFSPSVAGVGPRTMTYSLTNADGCVSQANATFTVNSVPSVQFGTQSSVCLNVDTISLSGASTSGDLSYFFNSNGLTQSISGKYLPILSGVGIDTIGYVGLKNSTGCSDTVFNTIMVHALPNTTLDTFPDLCINNLPATLNQGNPKTGGTGLYSGVGIVGTQFYPSIAKTGNHRIIYKFTDNNNCSTSDTEVVVVNSLPILTAATLSDLCHFDTLKTLSGALPIGGFYTGLNVDSATAVFSPDSVGVWNIKYHYTDTNGCENEIGQTQRVRALPAAQLIFANKFCDNASPIGLLGGSPIGNGGNYSGQGVSGTFYDPKLVTTLTDTLVYSFTDNFGCFNTDTVFVSFDSSASITSIPLPDICKGTASLDLSSYFSPAGGVYNGANVFGSNFIANLLDTGRFAMSYSYVDSNNCTTTARDTVIIRPLPAIQVSSDTGICQGDKIKLDVSGNYSYNWSTGDYLSTIQVSPVNTLSYSVTATNSYNCSTVENIGVTVFDQITVYTSSVNASCNESNGTAFTSVTGGLKPYNYSWSSGQRTPNARQLFAGIYQVTVNDKNGCTQYGVVGVNNESGPQVTVKKLIHNTCAGEENGEIEVSISNDTTYTIQWNNGATGTKLTDLESGIYELSVLGADGCSSFKSIEIKSPKSYDYQLIVENPDCDSSNGSVYLKLTNSLDSVSYSWINHISGDTLRNIGVGVYSAVVTNSSNCLDTVMVNLNTTASPRIKLDSIDFVDCGQANGLLAVSGIDPISSFKWSNGDTTSISKNLAIGTYVVTASDTNGCSTVEQFEIEANKLAIPQICKVTNDSLLVANVLTWDTTGSKADMFYVYRESSVRNQFFKLGSVGRNQAPRFEDKALINTTSIGTYSVVAVDACLNESEYSMSHKSILLNAKQTDSSLVEINWSSYQGNSFGDYYVYRYSTQFGLQLLDSVNSINSYIDYEVPANSSLLYYYVGIKGLTNCGDTGISTISNLSRDFGVSQVGIVEANQEDVSFLVWPNPNNGSFNVKLTGVDTEGSHLIVYDMHGKVMYKNGFDSSLQGSSQSVILSDISSGLYYVQFIQNETVITREIVVNR